MKRFMALIVSMVVLCGSGVYVTAASTDYSVKVTDKAISFIKNGAVVGTHYSRDGILSLTTSSGSLGLCYYNTANKYLRVTLGAQTTLDITGTIPTLTLDKSLSPDVQVTLGSQSNVTNLKVNSKNKLVIGGQVGTLTVSSGASVSVASGATVNSAKVTSSMASLNAVSGSTVKKVTATSGARITGKGIKSSSSTGSSSSSGATKKNVTLTAEYGDTLGDLWRDLNSKVKIYDSDGYRISGTAEWDHDDDTEVRDDETYDYTFYPNNNQYDETSGTAKISISGSSSDDDDRDSSALRVDVATIYTKASSARLRDLEKYLDEAVLAYNNHDEHVSGRAEWISDTSTSVRNGQSYSFIFVPDDDAYDSARGSVKIELDSNSNGVGGGELSLASFTLEAGYRDYLYDLTSQLRDNVRAYNASGSRVSGDVKWVSSDTRLTVTGTYRYEFIPDNSRYEKTKGDIKVYVSGTGSSGGSSGSNHNSSSSSSKLRLEIDDIICYSTNNRLRDLTSDLKDAVTARDSDGDTVSGTVKWVDSTSTRVKETDDYRFKFIPDSSKYDEVQDYVRIKVTR